MFTKYFFCSYSFASNTRDSETIFKNVCASCHVRGRVVITKESKSLIFSDLEKRGIAEIDSIKRLLIMVLAI